VKKVVDINAGIPYTIDNEENVVWLTKEGGMKIRAIRRNAKVGMCWMCKKKVGIEKGWARGKGSRTTVLCKKCVRVVFGQYFEGTAYTG